MVIIPNASTKCKDCLWSCFDAKYPIKGYVCGRNPFRDVLMGFEDTHADRVKRIIEEEEKKNAKKGSR